MSNTCTIVDHLSAPNSYQMEHGGLAGLKLTLAALLLLLPGTRPWTSRGARQSARLNEMIYLLRRRCHRLVQRGASAVNVIALLSVQ